VLRQVIRNSSAVYTLFIEYRSRVCVSSRTLKSWSYGLGSWIHAWEIGEARCNRFRVTVQHGHLISSCRQQTKPCSVLLYSVVPLRGRCSGYKL